MNILSSAIIYDLHVVQLYENNSEDIEPAHKRLRSSSYNDEKSLLLHTATTLTDYFSDDDDQDKESVHSWQGYETGKPTENFIKILTREIAIYHFFA